MTATANRALLPPGLEDFLPPRAAREAALSESVMACVTRWGYQRVAPPLMEFEDCLLSGTGGAGDISGQTFRLMDPVSQRMMGIRTDITVQVARISATRLAGAPRPLRLCYEGPVLRVRGSRLRPARAFTQAGFELIGEAGPAADGEVIALGAQVLSSVGDGNISVDLMMPRLGELICHACGVPADDIPGVRSRLNARQRDLSGLVPDAAELFHRLQDAAGPASSALDALRGLDLPEAAANEVARLEAVVGEVKKRVPQLSITVDPLESSGFEYHSGISFAFFAPAARTEVARGGRYLSGKARGALARQAGMKHDAAAEPATGVTFYMDTLLDLYTAPAGSERVWAPTSAPREVVEDLRRQGYSVVEALSPEKAPLKEAQKQECVYIWTTDDLKPVIAEEKTEKQNE